MGICESLFRNKLINQTPIEEPVKPAESIKPVNDIESDKKSNDTMNYTNIPIDQSYNCIEGTKKTNDNSSKEKKVIISDKNKPREISQKNDKDFIYLNSIGEKDKNYNTNLHFQQESTTKINPLFNNNCINQINQNKSLYFNNPKPTDSQISSYLGTNNNNVIYLNNSNIKMSNNEKINVSIHGSHITRSAYMNIPKQDTNQIYLGSSISE